MSTKRIVIDIPFNVDFRNYFNHDNTQSIFNNHFERSQTKEWIDYRIGIFMKYTAKSFMNQTNQNFLCIVRYNSPTKELVFDAISKYPALNGNIIFVTTEEANAIIHKIMGENDYLYHVNIDSDNMYEAHFIDQVDKYPYEEGIECLLCHEGYLYDVPTDRLAKMNHYSPSLFVYVYNKTTYSLYFRERLFEPHYHAEQRVNVGLAGRTYAIITHERNLDNSFDMIKNWLGDGTTVEGEEKYTILKEWGII